MESKDYISLLFLISRTLENPLDDINFTIGFLRLQDIKLYEPYLQYNIQKVLRKRVKSLIYKKTHN